MRSSDRGFTIMELLVSSVLSLIVVSLALGVTMAKKNVLGRDMVRTRLAQNLRGALDIIGADIRIAGENLSAAFPAVEIEDGAGSDPDVLIARRSLIGEVLKLCTQLNSGTSTTQVYFSIAGTVPGCIYSGNTTNYNSWRAYRLAQGGTLDAFIWDSAGRQGEFFQVSAETGDGTSYWLTRSGGSWDNTYPVGSSAIYVLEEWRYELNDGLLQVIQNQDPSSTFNVSFGVSGFQATALMMDGTSDTAFTSSDAWTSIEQLEIEISGTETFAAQPFSRTLTGRFFPRNVLSN